MPAFEVIPVVDLMGGVVVHGHAGDRDRYRPLAGSRLTGSAEPTDAVGGLLALHPFRRLYIADLDAILKRGDHRDAITALGGTFPGLELWVDAGVGDAPAAEAVLSLAAARLVLGSESQTDTGLLERRCHEPRLVLSLDLRGAEPLGPPALFECADLWPADIIVMTLARVGAGHGPDLEALRGVLTRAAGRRVWAAGGVRDAADLTALRDLGCAGVLVATALHDGRLGREELARAG